MYRKCLLFNVNKKTKHNNVYYNKYCRQKKFMIYNKLRDFRLCGVWRGKKHFTVLAEKQASNFLRMRDLNIFSARVPTAISGFSIVFE